MERRVLSPEELALLSGFGDVPTLHVLASHPSTRPPLLLDLARHRSEEVRWGVAVNPATPVTVLLGFRTVGRYSTINEYLARNPSLPPAILREMVASREAQRVSAAMNPACPADLMDEIARNGSSLDRSWLAANPELPDHLIARLAEDESPDVIRMLTSNPAYSRWRAASSGR